MTSTALDPYASVPPAPGLAAVVAVGRGGAIGAAGGLPWHIPSELAHFKRVTMGHAIIMGSTTWASIGRPLPGRHTVVLSRRGLEVPASVEVAGSIPEALALAAAHDTDPMVVGGAAVYAAFAPMLARLWWTDVAVDVPDADAHFPPLDEAEWHDVAGWPGDDDRARYRVRDRRSRL